jgi:thiosulfate/3-mercaptopyruvate sulfurtransferase
MMVLDVQPSIHDYVQEHLPGAVYVSEGLLRVSLGGMPTHYLPPEAMQPILRRLGLRAGVPAVVYTGVGPVKKGGDGLQQSAMAYALARFGHDMVYILDGGVDKWKAEGRPLTKAFPRVMESDYNVQVYHEYSVNRRQLEALLDRDDVLLVDSRPSDVYAGQWHWSKPGHIPGAINVPWTSFFDGENRCLLRPDEELQAVVDRHGITADKNIVCYCGTGRKATSQFLLFRWYLGFPRVRLYEGSFTEWSAYLENSTVAGSEPG